MHSAVVVEHVVQRNRVPMIGKFLAESICQARKASHVHPHREILPLHETGTDVLRIGIAAHDFHVAADALRWRISRFTVIHCAVDFL